MSASDTLRREGRLGALKTSLERIRAIFVKELIQLRRDRPTFAMIVGIPLMQLLLFGYAINTDPKHLPTALLVKDDGALARSFVAALRATDYFNIVEMANGRRMPTI